jgi:hypothetical protein
MKKTFECNLIAIDQPEGRSVYNTAPQYNSKNNADLDITYSVNLLQLFGGKYNDKFNRLRL